MENFKKSDLQIAAVIATGSATRAFSMAHQLGLACISLGTSLANKTKRFTNGSGIVTETANVTASDKPVENNFFLWNSLYWKCIQSNTLFSCNSGTYSNDNKDAWENDLSFSLASGSYQIQTAYSDRKNWEFINAIWEFTTIARHTWSIPVNETYTIECWGASGGTGRLVSLYNAQMTSCNIDDIYGRGAYAKGKINLNTNSNSGLLYIYVGGRGESVVTYNSLPGAASEYDKNYDNTYWKHVTAGGFNGGGIGAYSPSDDHSGGGGGATDVRLKSGETEWDSRIIVAAGGGGGNGINSPTITSALDGIHGGTPNITNASMATWNTTYNITVNQSTGYQKGVGRPSVHGTSHSPGGGGGGYMGGTYSVGSSNHYGPASGGSSFISGYPGCASISGFTFLSGTMSFVSGYSSSCPNTTIGGSARARVKEDGYARITLERW